MKQWSSDITLAEKCINFLKRCVDIIHGKNDSNKRALMLELLLEFEIPQGCPCSLLVKRILSLGGEGSWSSPSIVPNGEIGFLGPFLERWVNNRDQRVLSRHKQTGCCWRGGIKESHTTSSWGLWDGHGITGQVTLMEESTFQKGRI